MGQSANAVNPLLKPARCSQIKIKIQKIVLVRKIPKYLLDFLQHPPSQKAVGVYYQAYITRPITVYGSSDAYLR